MSTHLPSGITIVVTPSDCSFVMASLKGTHTASASMEHCCNGKSPLLWQLVHLICVYMYIYIYMYVYIYIYIYICKYTGVDGMHNLSVQYYS